MNVTQAIRRARDLGPGMVAFRVGQRVRRRWSGLRADLFGEPSVGLAEPPDWKRRRFLLDEGDRAWIREQFAGPLLEARDALIAEAESVLAGRARLLTGELHDFGGEVTWDRDPRTACPPWPRAHFTRLDALRLGEPCDIKIPWELGRGTHLLRLAQAWCLTGEERFASGAAAGIDDFLRRNPPEFGAQWVNGMEVGLRLIHWIWIDWLCRASAAFSPEVRGRLWWGVREGARYIGRFPEREEVSGNHFWFNGLGLWYAGAFLEGPARGWRRTGRRIVLGELFRQTRADGTSFEQSTGYHRLVTEMMLHALRLEALEDGAMEPAVLERVGRMVAFSRETGEPGGRAPHVGDHDDGRVVAFADGDPWDHGHIPACFDAMEGVAPRAGEGLAARAERAWLVGRGPRATRGEGTAPNASSPRAIAFPEGGFYVMRAGPISCTWDAGPLGKPGNGVHGHADTLSGEVRVDGVPVLVDSGTYGYTGDPARRNRLRGTAAHSLVQVDGLELAEPGTGPELWRFLGDVPVQVLEFRQGTERLVLRAEHSAYLGRAGVRVRREVALDAAGARLAIRDEVLGEGDHASVLRWHLAPLDWHLDTSGGLVLRARVGNRDVRLSARAEGGRASVTEAEHSVRWGELHRAPVLEVELRGAVPHAFETFLEVAAAGTLPERNASP